jgi:hypothetical protein
MVFPCIRGTIVGDNAAMFNRLPEETAMIYDLKITGGDPAVAMLGWRRTRSASALGPVKIALRSSPRGNKAAT